MPVYAIFVALMLPALLTPGLPQRLLSGRVMTWLVKRSYSIYLVQAIAHFVVLLSGESGLVMAVLTALVAVFFASGCHRSARYPVLAGMSEVNWAGPDIQVIGNVPDAPPTPTGGSAVTVLITLPAGSPGGPPHRHSGPAFGYVIKGALLFEIEGAPERVIRAGEAFWEPGGDVIHYQDANHLTDAETVFTATTFVAPGQPLLTVVSDEELEARKHLRAPRP